MFNESLMNDAVYKFKRYEDASLTYTGIDSHASDTQVGLYSTSISREEYEAMAGLLATSMEAPAVDVNDVPDRPYFVNQPAQDEDEEEPVASFAYRLATQKAAGKPLVQTGIQADWRRPYRPSFVPPKPAMTTAKSAKKLI